MHTPHVQAESVLAGELGARREVVDFLMYIESLIEVALALSVGPENVPVVAIGLDKAINLEYEPDKLRVTLEHLVVDGGIFHTIVASLSPCKVGLT